MNDMDDAQKQRIEPAQWKLAGVIAAFVIAVVMYKLLMHERLGHSAAMFIGLPAVLAVLLAIAPRAKTSTGAILKGITVALLLVAPMVGEGYVCILIAAPLFYVVGIVMGLIFDWQRGKQKATVGCVALVLILPMSLEGVLPGFNFDRAQTVVAERIVASSAAVVESALAGSLRVETPLPGFLSIGFPRPLVAYGEGLQVGDTRTVHFSGAEGDPPGDLVLRVAERRPGYVRFEAVSDGSKLTQWVRWRGSEVEWKAVDEGHTRVTWRVAFERQLDPAWYFAPLERMAVKEAANHLISANAIPARRD